MSDFEVKVPDIGDFEDVPIVELMVSVGDEVDADDPLITLESDKSAMDIPAPESGTVEELMVDVGDAVSEGDVICTLSGVEGAEDSAEGGGETEGDEDDGDGAEGSGESDEASPEGDDSSQPDDDEEESEAADGGASGDRGDSGAGAGSSASGAEGASEAPIYASPAVRRLAREQGVDLAKVEGTGRKGRITKDDVESYEPGEAESAAGEGGAAIEGLDLAPWPQIDFEEFGPTERVELSRIKQISGPNLARNWVHIPHVTQHDEADITELEAFRKQINSEQDVKVTMVALLLKACIPVLKQFPNVNASLDREGGLIHKRYYHLGFAADTPQGLLVPVIRDVDQKGLLEIAAELIELSGKAREGKLGPKSMQGASFTISSLGGIGGTGFTPIVNAPEVAILGATRAVMRPVWDAEAEEFEPRLMVPLSFSYDHRVIDGAAAARFVVELVKVLSDFKRVLL